VNKTGSDAPAAPEWSSVDQFRVVLSVDSRGRKRSHSPASVDLDFAKALFDAKASGDFDESSIEVIAYDTAGKPRVYDASRKADEKFLLPWRLERYYGSNRVTLHFVLPDDSSTRYAVYFDTRGSGHSHPERYAGLVGDGDYFDQNYQRREIGASHMDCFCDFDGDGDLDLFKATVEPFVYCYESVGGNRFVDRGRLTSDERLFVFPHGNGSHRSWPVLTFADWEDDGDQDLFVTFNDGPESGQVVRYENTTPKGGPVTLVNRGRLLGRSGESLGSGWFAAVTVVDWDGDGKKDLLVTRHELEGQLDDLIEFHRNIGNNASMEKIDLAGPVYLETEGSPIKLRAGRVECEDIDDDGDLDLLAARQGPPLQLFRNIGTRTKPVLDRPIDLPLCGGGHVGAKIADFDGDGLLDYVAGHLWESNSCGQGRHFARLYKNVGTRKEPKFEPRDAQQGAPYSEQFQKCDGARQNTVRAVDWDNDGKTDLLVGTARGDVLWFRNQTNELFPLFEQERRLVEKLSASARLDVCDWNNDGKKDLIVANVDGQVWLFLNRGTDQSPILDSWRRLLANGKPIDGTHWASVLVCDWNADGRKDLILGMGGEKDPSDNVDWPPLHDNPFEDRGFLVFINTGSDADPKLARPQWIKAGPKAERSFDYLRPNLGSFVDWDGDGRKDLIACEFENVVRLYRNVGGLATVPELAAGEVILQPWTVQMISGADVKDFNRDGDLDIVTGQGHGGTGLRFFERDYIEDTLHDSPPIVTAGAIERQQGAS